MKDLKYLAAFAIPIVAIVGITLKGPFAWATLIFAFGDIPLLELVLPIDTRNLESDVVETKLKLRVFDWLLYLNLPLVYGILGYSIYTVYSVSLSTSEFIGLIFTLGIVLSVTGINVAHELGHRQNTNERFIGKALFLAFIYMHFYIEHNFGHHLHAATPEDPATAKYNQTVYSFWITSTWRQYVKLGKFKNTFCKSKVYRCLVLKMTCCGI